MPPEPTPPIDPGVNQDPPALQEPTPPAAPPIEPGDPIPEPIPYARFQEVNTRMKEAESKLTALKADQEKVRQKQLEEKGEFKTLAEERATEIATLKKENEEFQADQTKRRDAILSELSDDDKKFAEENLPALSSLEEFSKRIAKPGGGTGDPRPLVPGDKIEAYDSTWSDEKKAEWHKKTIDKYAAAKK